MNPSLQRASLLREHRRHEEAVAMLHQHLANDPQDAAAHVELALNRIQMPGQRALAIDDIRRAIALEPDAGHLHALHARILTQLDRPKDALAAAEQAITLDPGDDFCWSAKGEALIALSRWKDAEAALNEALEIDPDSELASNLLAIALRHQNRLDDSNDESMRRLARDPENPVSLANAGWTALHRGKPAEAEKFFLEALRIDPELDFAREGLKESFRARSAFYRLFLRWAFFMQRFSEKNQMWILIGIVIGFRLVRKTVQEINPALLPPLFVVFYLFLFGTWLSTGIANLTILRDKAARLSLDRSEKLDGLFTGGGFLIGFLAGVTGFAIGHTALTLAGAVLMLAAIPTSMFFTNASKLGRVVFGVAAALVYVTGIPGVIAVANIPAATLLSHGAGVIGLPMLITFATTWIAMIPALRKAPADA
jgi:tetratricopeptide (TPR) repeat protein